ncbi:HYR domain-containing protein [Corallococcus llansteffanensis]|uniref:HYR domain-containing protein n=1 Tax=Corallococcus llansteffanensis TaxID=2316731 RepID=A0A3A8QJW5_9BACT|nr:HYR domain-containing protein [Corallococcus llansteffanensis]
MAARRVRTEATGAQGADVAHAPATATGRGPLSVTYSREPGPGLPLPTATDAGTAAPRVTSSHVSGALFPLGATEVAVAATDDMGNASSCAFTVSVRDRTPPEPPPRSSRQGLHGARAAHRRTRKAWGWTTPCVPGSAGV